MIEAQNSDPKLKRVTNFMINRETSGSDSKRLQNESSMCYIAEDGLLMRYVGPRGKPWEEESDYWRIWAQKVCIQTL